MFLTFAGVLVSAVKPGVRGVTGSARLSRWVQVVPSHSQFLSYYIIRCVYPSVCNLGDVAVVLINEQLFWWLLCSALSDSAGVGVLINKMIIITQLHLHATLPFSPPVLPPRCRLHQVGLEGRKVGRAQLP